MPTGEEREFQACSWVECSGDRCKATLRLDVQPARRARPPEDLVGRRVLSFLTVPQPYDFERSLDRFTFWGVDRANVWYEGGLHRVVDGREVRIAPAEGGVDVEPFDEAIEPVVRKLLGLAFDLPPFIEFAQRDPVLADEVRLLPGFRPPLAPDPFEALVSSVTAQQVSLHSAFAVRSRFIDRFGVAAAHAVAFPTRERVAGRRRKS